MHAKITINEVLSSQSALTAQRDVLRHIASAITTQQGIVAQSVDDEGLPQMEHQRDDLAAALALGVGDSASLSKIEGDISRLKTLLAETHEQVSRANSALAGLQRKYDEEADTLLSMEAAHSRLLLSHLRSEADEVQRAYIDSAREVVKQYLRIVALAELSRTIDLNAGGFVPFTEFAIPVSLQLASGAGVRYINDGVLFSSTHMGYFSEIPDALAELRGDLQQAGIDLA